MKKIALIPARYGATRFPGKMMADLGGKPVIVWTYLSTLHTGLFDEVIVATDSAIIADAVRAHGATVFMSQVSHESGSDRIAEAAAASDADIVVNVQGDEPFVKREPLEKLLRVFEGDEGEKVQVASLMQALAEKEQIINPNFVKVVVNLNKDAMFFSRSVLPYPRDEDAGAIYYEHIGVYAYRKEALIRFASLPQTPLERSEKIECLRLLENGIPIKMVETVYMGVEIDTPDDIMLAEKYLSQHGS